MRHETSVNVAIIFSEEILPYVTSSTSSQLCIFDTSRQRGASLILLVEDGTESNCRNVLMKNPTA
jgi:hypothetical protein